MFDTIVVLLVQDEFQDLLEAGRGGRRQAEVGGTENVVHEDHWI